MIYVQQYFSALADLITDLWIWLLIGFLAAGVVAEFVPSSFVTRHFGRNDLRSLVKATLSGLVASTCSCGAIPMAVTLRNRGATTAVALTFLLATPWSGMPQFMVLSKFLGVSNTIFIMISALATALLAGLVLSRLEDRHIISEPSNVVNNSTENSDGCVTRTHQTYTIGGRLLGVLRGSWESVRGIGKYLAIGLLLAAALSAFASPNLVGEYLGSQNSGTSILIALPISVVIELCSEGFSVFSGQLFAMGASLGVVFVMLMVGVTTDITEISVVWGRFGRRWAIAYVLVSTLMATGMAYIVNAVWYLL